MDLGTANTIIISDGKVLVDEPSVVALDRRTEKMIAVGSRAKMMYEKTNPDIRTIRPLRDGVIADFNACEQMMRGLIKKIHTGTHLFTPSLKMVIGVPSGSTEVELRAVRDSAEHAGGREVYLIYEPMAAAIGIGIDVLAPEGNMIVDIGGGSTEIAVISLYPEDKNDIKPQKGQIYKQKVEQLNKDKETIAIYESAADASRQTGISVTQIRKVCQGKGYTAGGYYWRYRKEGGAK